MGNRSPYRDALRLLYILVAGSSPLPDNHESGAVAIFKGEKRLHAFDFWMRNPDYLAEELLDLYERTSEARFLDEAIGILDAEEPDIRRFPMIRWKFGAYEPLDDTLSVLVCRKLIKITGRKSPDRVLETSYLISSSAITLTQRIVVEFPPLAWYAQRAKLVAEIAGDSGGAALKDRQYKKEEYAETQWGGMIPAITSKVRARLNALTASRTN
jgi:hypothetical protein